MASSSLVAVYTSAYCTALPYSIGMCCWTYRTVGRQFTTQPYSSAAPARHPFVAGEWWWDAATVGSVHLHSHAAEQTAVLVPPLAPADWSSRRWRHSAGNHAQT